MDPQAKATALNEELFNEQTDSPAEETASEETATEATTWLPQEKPLPKWVVPTVIAAVAVTVIVLFFTVFGGYKLFMSDEQLIQARFDALASAMSNGDIDGVTDSFEREAREALRNRDGYEELRALYRVLGASVDFRFELTELTIDGDRATASLLLTGTSFGNTETKPLDELSLVKENGDWYLVDLTGTSDSGLDGLF